MTAPKTYLHDFDIVFCVKSTKENPADLTAEELATALAARLVPMFDVRTGKLSAEFREAVGHIQTTEEIL